MVHVKPETMDFGLLKPMNTWSQAFKKTNEWDQSQCVSF